MGSERGTNIDPRAVVHQGAQIDQGARVGPFSVIGPHVKIGSGTVVDSHVFIDGRTTIGRENRIFPFASVGAQPQDLKYNGEESEVVIGDRNQIRECATIHRGTEGGGMITRVGNGNLFMAYTHVAHDCVIGNDVVMANAATLGGHVTISDGAIIGGLAGIHQFCRIGSLAMIAGGAVVVMDVPPFTQAQGDRARLFGLNLIGLKRKGISPKSIDALKLTYKIIFRLDLKLEDALVKVEQEVVACQEVREMIDFIQTSERGITR